MRSCYQNLLRSKSLLFCTTVFHRLSLGPQARILQTSLAVASAFLKPPKETPVNGMSWTLRARYFNPHNFQTCFHELMLISHR